jgi:tyrosyl-tRNA synthetase
LLDLKIGGSDQLGNFKAGFENIRAETGNLSLGICVPLITDRNGNKLGKSSKSNTNEEFWLNAEKTSFFDFYQYFRQLHGNFCGNITF